MTVSPATAALQTPRPWLTGLLVALLIGLWFGFLQYRDLFNPDEGRYAEIPREMVATGDFVTPRLNGLKYFEKPALQYWMTAAAYQVFGAERWTARLWVALTGFLSIVMVFVTGRRLGGPTAGWLAALALASSFQFVMFGQLLTLDMGVGFFMALTLCALFGALDLRLSAGARHRWALLMWAAMALAILSKGLIGVVLPGLVLTLYMLIQREWRFLGRLHWWSGLALFALIAVPWFAQVQSRNPEFFDFFFIREHFSRFATTGHHRPGVWYLFIVLLLVGSLPWTLGYLRAMAASWRTPRAKDLDVHAPRLLLIWVVAITAFFSVSSSKLPGYVIPVYPALALLLGVMASRLPSLQRAPVIEMAFCGIGLLVFSPMLANSPKLSDPLVPQAASIVIWMRAAGVVFLAGAALAWWQRGRRPAGWLAASLCSLLAVQLLIASAQTMAPRYSGRQLAIAASTAAVGFEQGVDFFSVGMYDQTMPLQLQRLMTIVDYADELTFGLTQEPQLGATRDQFRQRWRAAQQAYAIMPDDVLEQERANGLPFTRLAGSGRETIIARRAPGAADDNANGSTNGPNGGKTNGAPRPDGGEPSKAAPRPVLKPF